MIAIDLNLDNIPSPNQERGQNTTQQTQQAQGVIEHLKDQFGDYSDPMAYDWTWRETD